MQLKKDTFISGVISLVISQIIVKVFGLFYSIYLTNKIGDSGNAIYMGGYQIYVLLLTISSVGVPNAISKLISEKIAQNDLNGAKDIFRLALFAFGTIGFFCSIMLFLSGKIIAKDFLKISECSYSLKFLAPAIFFVSMASVIKGYFNGIGQISITAKSQTFEQILKSLLIIFCINYFHSENNNEVVLASFANLASTIAIILSFIYMLINYLKLKKYTNSKKISQINLLKYNNSGEKYKEQNNKFHIIKNIFRVSIPITLSAILSTLSKNIDSITIVRILIPIFGETIAKERYGILSSKVDMMTNVPLSFNIALSVALIPAISKGIAKKDLKIVNQKLYLALLLTAILAFPSAVGMSIFSNQILKLLFPNASKGGELLRISSICIIFLAVTQTISSALQAIGKAKTIINAMIIGGIIKFISNILLIPIIYEKGAIFANLISDFVVFIIILKSLKQSIKLNFSIIKLMIKPAISAIIMGYLSYILFINLENYINFKLCIIISIIFAIFIYGIQILFIYKKEFKLFLNLND